VFVAAAGPEGTRVERHRFPGGRAAVRRAGCEAALKLLIRMLKKQGE
jgi:nicotinamide mononucleotide (NMN) deamidase PncC